MTYAQLVAGQSVGQYRIISHIARGGMADVYLAEDVGLKREAALKVMLEVLAQDPLFVRRFRREARSVARLDHPNIVQVYSTGLLASNQPYIAMQYIEGGSLRDKLEELAARGKLLTAEQALNIVRQVALALGVAHDADIVHRDLKPSNVLIRPDGAPVLVDLGIVAVGSGGAKLTQTGSLIGTPSYMSPDQVRGGEVDGRSDLYSLGVILYEMLTGRRPFEAEEPIAVLHQQVYEEPVPLRKRRPDLSEATAEIVNRCMKKEPGRRYQKAAALVAAIDRALAAEGVQGPNPGATQVLTHLHDSELISKQQVVRIPTIEKRPGRRVPVWVLAIVASVVIALALGYAFGIGLKGPDDVKSTPTPNPAVKLLVQIPAETPHVSAQSIEDTSTSTATPTPLASNSPTPTKISPTSTLFPTDTPEPTIILYHDRIVFQSNRDDDFEIYVMNRDGFNQIQLTHNEVDDNYPVVSPDGARMLFESYRDGNWEVYAMEIDGSNVRRLTFAPDSKDRLPTWSPDGREVAFISDRDGDYDIYIMNVDGSNLRQVTFTDFREGHVSWSVDDRLAYNAGLDSGSTWEIYTIGSNGQNQQRLTNNGVSDWAPEWSPDGRLILYLSIVGNNDPAIFVMNADGSGQRLLYNSEDYEWGADWSADGTQIVFTKDDGEFSNLYIMNSDGSGVRLLTLRGGYPSWVK